MGNIVWQLPVIQSDLTDHDWIHPKAKYHAFLNNISICDKYSQDTNYFETSIEASELLKNRDLPCKKCLSKMENA
jgi:preprotein translocase subunit SecA